MKRGDTPARHRPSINHYLGQAVVVSSFGYGHRAHRSTPYSSGSRVSLVSSRNDRSRVAGERWGPARPSEAVRSLCLYAYERLHGKPDTVSCKSFGTTERGQKVLRWVPTTAQAAAASGRRWRAMAGDGRRWLVAGTELLQLRRRSLEQMQDYLTYPHRLSRKWFALEP